MPRTNSTRNWSCQTNESVSHLDVEVDDLVRMEVGEPLGRAESYVNPGHPGERRRAVAALEPVGHGPVRHVRVDQARVVAEIRIEADA